MQYTYSMKNYSPDELADAELMTLINSSQKTRSIFTMKKIMYICVALAAIGWILPESEPNNSYSVALAKTEKVEKAPTAQELRAKKLSKLESQLAGECRWRIKNSATYPSKVDFNGWSRDTKTFMNHFSKSQYPNLPHRFVYSIKAEMMNGFGAMLPKDTACFVNFSDDLESYKVVNIDII